MRRGFRPAAQCLTCLLAAATAAQVQFRPVTKEHLATPWPAARIITSDADRDGDVDLVVSYPAGTSNLTKLLRNDGAGLFTSEAGFGPSSSILSAFDADGDGDDDLLLGGDGVLLELWHNDGNGTYSRGLPLPSVPAATTAGSVVAGDVDGDGDIDLILASWIGSVFFGGSPKVLLLNSGNAVFVVASAAQLPPDRDWTVSLALGDVDGDGDLDLVCGNAATQVWTSDRLHLNDGRGFFSHAPAGYLPGESRAEAHMAFFDCDGDGDQDLLCARVSAPAPTPALGLYVNQGNGQFSDGTAMLLPADPTPEHRGFAIGDVDGDGRPDIVIDGEEISWLRRTASGPFVNAGALLPGSSVADNVPVAAVDLNGDRRVDLALARGPAPALLFQDARGGFQDGCRRAAREWQYGTMLADLDGDGFVDGITGHGRILRNDGQGVFRDITANALPPATQRLVLHAHRDIDGDGDIDLVGVSAATRFAVFANRGNATFQDVSATHAPIPAPGLTAVTLGWIDVEGDADADLVVADGNGGGSWLYLNDGSGRFGSAVVGRLPPTTGYDTIIIAAADVDRDGDADLILGSAGWSGRDQSLLLLNDGAGTFRDATTTHLPPGPSHPNSVATGDIDGDGDLDLVFGGSTSSSYPDVRMRICRNGGDGRYVDTTPATPRLSGFPTLVDVDEDGDLDLLGDATSSVHLNDGRGTFTPAARGQAGSGAVGDIDGDGDPDVNLVTNHHRQLRTPYLLRAGAPYAIVLEWQPGYAVAEAWGACLLGTRALQPPVPLMPWGMLRIDPATAVALPALHIPAASGRAELRFRVPTNAFVTGLDLHVQALIAPVGSLANARFTGLLVDRGM